MPKRHSSWMRLRLPDGYTPPAGAMSFARKALGTLLEYAAPGQLGVAARHYTMQDGTKVGVRWDGTTPIVSIHPSIEEETPPAGDLYNLWVPRGFVVCPAWHDAPGGVGLPIINAEGADNLAPGLDRAHWTAGGPCGEVLLSPDKQAGYPPHRLDIVVPLLFHPTKGPVFRWPGKGAFDAREATGAWQSYRIEFVEPVANYTDEDAAGVKALLSQISAYRVANAQPALNLPVRGYYRPAKIAASIMQAAGSTAETAAGYPDTYKTADDRTTKDGYSADVIGVPFDTFARGDHLTTFELRHLGGGAADTLTAWQQEPTENALLLRDVGPAAFGDAGFRGGFWCADIIQRDRWIAAGNMSWQSPDPSLPPLSWHGFASLNLAWETYPAVYDPGNYTTAPLVPVRGFTDNNGDCWLRYPRAANPKAADIEPAMGRHIYCRGRAIALAPRGGLVWGACVAVVPATSMSPAIDRLIALVHHPDEQPADYTHEGFTRYLRVWWCDVPRRAHLRMTPQQTICGADEADPWGWRGGQQIDLGVMPAPAAGFVASPGVNSLKYASQWRFSPDGTKAVCLRDYGTFADYSVLGTWRVLASMTLNARTAELTFDVQPPSGTDLGSVTASVAFHEYTAGETAPVRELVNRTPPGTTDTFGIAMYEFGAYPTAVDYTAQGALLYAYNATVGANQGSTYADPASVGSFIGTIEYEYLGIGGAGVQYATDMGARVLHGARFQSPQVDTEQDFALVLDVASASFAAKVTRPRYAVDPASPLMLTALDRPCQTFTGVPMDGVRLFSGGALVREDWYPCPDGALYSVNGRCFTGLADSNQLLVFLPLAASANVQGYYATRFGQHVLSYQCAPTPRAAWVLSAEPSSSECGCQLTNAAITASHLMTDAEWAPRGGASVSSVPLPANDWLIYAKVA